MRTARLPTPLAVATAFCLTGAACNKGPASVLPPSDNPAARESAARELASVLSDEFCYCGCPHTLGQCLKEHAGCQHGPRMAGLAEARASAGAARGEIIERLGRYYQGFKDPRTSSFAVDERQCRGNKDANVTIVEFADFECPYCGMFRPTMDELANKHPDLIRVCYAPYLLPAHQGGQIAAVAAMVARDKGKFWEMHDRLFAHQLELTLPVIKGLAAEIGVPAAEVQLAVDTGRYAAELESTKERARAAGGTVLPAIFINGRQHPTIMPPIEELERAVDDELEWQAHPGSWSKD